MLYILNTGMVPVDWDSLDEALIRIRKISLDEAISTVASEPFVSAVGHEATAQALSLLLGVDIPMNRTAVKMREGDKAIHFVLKGRLPEGKVLTSIEEIESIGYQFLLSEIVGL